MSDQPASIDDLLRDHQSRHSEFQIEHFVVNKGNWTVWGRYKQALREIAKRREAITHLKDELELARIDRDESSGSWSFRSTTRRRKEIHHRQLENRILCITRDMADIERELVCLARIADSLKRELGTLSPERRAKLEEETWQTRLRAMAVIDLVTQHRITEPTLSLMISAPRTWRRPLFRKIHKTVEELRARGPGSLANWIEKVEEPGPLPPELSEP